MLFSGEGYCSRDTISHPFYMTFFSLEAMRILLVLALCSFMVVSSEVGFPLCSCHVTVGPFMSFSSKDSVSFSPVSSLLLFSLFLVLPSPPSLPFLFFLFYAFSYYSTLLFSVLPFSSPLIPLTVSPLYIL